MRREILIFAILLSNVAFGSTLPVEIREVREIDTNRCKVNSLASAVSEHLFDRGLDKDVAHQKVSKALAGSDSINALMAQNIINSFDSIQYKDVVSYIGESALFGKKVNLSSYKDIVALLQKSNKVVLNRATLLKVEKLSLESKNAKSV